MDATAKNDLGDGDQATTTIRDQNGSDERKADRMRWVVLVPVIVCKAWMLFLGTYWW